MVLSYTGEWIHNNCHTFSMCRPTTRNWPCSLSTSKCLSSSSSPAKLTDFPSVLLPSPSSPSALRFRDSCTKRRTLYMSSVAFSPVAAEMPITRVCPASRRMSRMSSGRRSLAAGMSILFSATTWVFRAKAGLNSCSSWLIARESPKGSGLSALTTCTSTLQTGRQQH